MPKRKSSLGRSTKGAKRKKETRMKMTIHILKDCKKKKIGGLLKGKMNFRAS